MLWQKVVDFIKWGAPLWLFLIGGFAIIFAIWGFYKSGFSGEAVQVALCGIVLLLYGVIFIIKRRQKQSQLIRGKE